MRSADLEAGSVPYGLNLLPAALEIRVHSGSLDRCPEGTRCVLLSGAGTQRHAQSHLAPCAYLTTWSKLD